MLWTAANTVDKNVYETALGDMAKINPLSVHWLLEHADPQHWAELYFPGKRYVWSSHIKYCWISQFLVIERTRNAYPSYVWMYSASIDGLVYKAAYERTQHHRVSRFQDRKTNPDIYQWSSTEISVFVIQ